MALLYRFNFSFFLVTDNAQSVRPKEGHRERYPLAIPDAHSTEHLAEKFAQRQIKKNLADEGIHIDGEIKILQRWLD